MYSVVHVGGQRARLDNIGPVTISYCPGVASEWYVCRSLLVTGSMMRDVIPSGHEVRLEEGRMARLATYPLGLNSRMMREKIGEGIRSRSLRSGKTRYMCGFVDLVRWKTSCKESNMHSKMGIRTGLRQRDSATVGTTSASNSCSWSCLQSNL